ncbi:AAA family ATPase [Candidatus Nomurabacteria bacterium]|nr:AAA family ATPase [Candidatus Nomurabacteria bacterium]
MRLNSIEINGFKSFAKKTSLEFLSPVVSVVGPNGSGKSNVVEAFRFVLGEQSMKSMRGKAGSDLVFKGSKNLPKGTRASVTIYFNNADKVFKLSNESGENINLNYDIISISREVHIDGLNKYILNGTEVRLKDIQNLLASVNIGSSGHHIISQGEADRILNASPRDRREMVEDALGLKVYQYKIKESERKLDRTNTNMKEVVLLRRENAPHLNFLKKQVEKFEKAKDMKVELLGLYKEYLKKESVYLDQEKNNLNNQKNKISAELSIISEKISNTEENNSLEENKKTEEVRNLEKKISEIRAIRGEMDRKLGRIEGMIEMEEHRAQKPVAIKQENKIENIKKISIEQEEFADFLREANEYLEEAMHMDILENVAPILQKIKDILDRFARVAESREPSSSSNLSSFLVQSDHSEISRDLAFEEQLQNLKQNQQEILIEMQNLQTEENKILSNLEILKNEINKEIESKRESEREKFNLKMRHSELSSLLNVINVKAENLSREIENFENEIKEGSVLVGYEILSYKDFEIQGSIDRYIQEEQKRKIERLKIKLEDAGLIGGAEVMKEYEEVSERDNFLAKELEDLAKSIESLRVLMADLKEKIDFEFKEGVKKINTEFQEFFSIMFGGGSAFLSVVAEQKKKKDDGESDGEDIVFEHGIEINVSLPHKKVKELHALSGGERSLTSIALLFAMSQVNPPPFLVLDETDAALDEANSRRYGDMVEKLSKHSQLIVVTHNRETMSRAGVLYGVTIGADGGSKLLSIKFDEAAAIAK